MPSIFLSHSSSKDSLAGVVRDRIVQKMKASGFTVLFDREMLGGGMVWRPILHRWLGECDAAVILFSPDALDSDWVLKEVTILSWRKSLGSRLRVVPVLVGCERASVVNRRAYKPLDLENLQFRQLDGTCPAPQAAEKLADQVVEDLAGVLPDAAAVPLQEWLRTLALLLGKVDPVDHLQAAAELLGIDASARARFDDLPLTVAHQLLHTPLSDSYPAFKKLRRGLDRDYFRYLADLVVPTWVSVEAAAKLSGVIARPPGRRQLTINSEKEPTGRHYLQRATCGAVESADIVTVSEVTGADDEEELLSRYERALWDEACIDSGPVDRGLLRKAFNAPNVRMYIMLKTAATRAILLPSDGGTSLLEDELVDAYKRTTFVFLTRDRALWDASDVAGLEQITPELSPESEDEAQVAQWRIDRLLRENRPAGGDRS